MKIFGRLFLILFFVCFTSHLTAQLYFTADVEGYYDDNIFNNYLNTADFINGFRGELGYDIESEQNNFELYYFGYLNQYYKYTDKSSVIHKAGIVETYLFSRDDNPLNIGINYTARVNKSDYMIYDFNQLSAYANYMHSISESDKLQIGVIGNRIEYDNYSLFSHYQAKAFLRSINSFESRTSLTSAVEIDNKIYIENKSSQGLADEIIQAKLFLQAGQGITDDFGISGYVFFRKNLKGGNRYFSSNEFLFYEEELFYDIYSNEGVETGLTLTYLFLPNIVGKIGGKYELRNFTDLPAADLNGNELNDLRQDNQFSAGATVEFGLSKILAGLYLSLNYNYIRNSSNDYYYDYTNQVFSVIFGFGF